MNLLVNPALCHIDRISHKCHVAQMSRYQNITRHKKSYLLRISHCVKNVTSIWYLCFYRIVADISRCRNVTSMLQICFTESVAQMSLLQKCHVKCDKNVTLLKYHRPPTWENDPPTWEIAPWELVWPPWELILDAPDGK